MKNIKIKFTRYLLSTCAVIFVSSTVYAKPLPESMRFGVSTELWAPALKLIGAEKVKELVPGAKLSQGLPMDFYIFYGHKVGDNMAVDGTLLIPIPKKWELGASADDMFEAKFINTEICVVPRLILGWFYFKVGLGAQMTLSAKAKNTNSAIDWDNELDSEESNLKERNAISTFQFSMPFGFGMETPYGINIGINTALISTFFNFIPLLAAVDSSNDKAEPKGLYNGMNNLTRNNFLSIDFTFNIAQMVNAFS